MVQRLQRLLQQAKLGYRKVKEWLGPVEGELTVTITFPDTAQGRAARDRLIFYLESQPELEKTD